MALSPNTKKLIIRIVFFLVYLLVGAAIFQAIELPHEKKRRNELQFDIIQQNFTKKYNISGEDMKCFLQKLKKALELGFDLQEAAFPKLQQWHFMNAFFFAGNVVTTIGYGHIVPTSPLGRIICILYALFGIPLTGLTLRSVGNRISEGISTAVKMFERKVYNRETEKLEIKTVVIAFLLLIIVMIMIPAIGFQALENWDYLESVYFCFITLSTVGFGDFVPVEVKKRYEDNETIPIILELLNLLYMVVGLAVMSGVIVAISGVIEEKTKNIGMPDPLETLRAIQVGNLNSKAMKKLGYKMGPSPSNEEMRQRIPPRAISTNTRAFDNQLDHRCESANNMDFKGPTPILHLNRNNVVNDGGGTDSPALSPKNSSKRKPRFNNKVEPAESKGDTSSGEPEGRRISTFSSVDNRSDSHDDVERELAPNYGNGQMSTLTEKAGSRNELIVQVQITPVPTPRSSPAPSPAPMEKEHSNPREEASIEIKETRSCSVHNQNEIPSKEGTCDEGLPHVEEVDKGGIILNGFPGRAKTLSHNEQMKKESMEMNDHAQQLIKR